MAGITQSKQMSYFYCGPYFHFVPFLSLKKERVFENIMFYVENGNDIRYDTSKR